ncbi:MAG: MMPL family transporter [Candidatus Aminicenantaceae bacterium]
MNLLTDKIEKELTSWEDILYVQTKPFDFNDVQTAAHMIRTVLLNSDSHIRQRFASKFSESGIRRELLKTKKRLITLPDPSLREMVISDVLNIREILIPFYETRMGNFKFSYLSGYFDAEDGKARIIFIQPAGFSEDADFSAEFINRVDSTITNIKNSLPDTDSVQHSLTGKYAIIGESIQILKSDMKIITLVATILIILLLGLSFRNFRAVLVCFLPLLISILAVFVFARIFFNPLNFMAMGFVAIILGLGVDVSLHCTARFFQIRSDSSSAEDAVVYVLNDTGPPVVIGLCSTALVFMCLVFAEYKALFQFGLLTSLGLLLTLGVSLILFPTAVRIFGPRQGKSARPIRFRRFPAWLNSFPLDKPYISISAAIIFLIGSLYFVRWFSFDMDFFVAFPKKLETLDTARKVSERFGSAVFMNSQITVEANDFKSVMAAQKIIDEKLIKLILENKIDSFQSSSLFFPYSLENSDFSAFQQTASGIEKNKHLFFELLDELKFQKNEEYETYYEIIESAVENKIGETLDFPGEMESLPQLKKFMIEENGKIFLQTYIWPKYNYDDNLPSDKNIFHELTSLSTQVNTELYVTSTYQVFKKIGEIVRKDFFRVSFFSLLAVLILVFIFFRNVSCVLLSLLPLIGAVPFTLAFVVLAKISFSPFQIGMTALLIGIGIDDAVHLLTRTRFGEKKKIKEVLPEIGPVITLTTLSTIFGFGALIFSHNQSVSSMGFVIAVGVFSCLLFTFILIPALLGIMEKKK